MPGEPTLTLTDAIALVEQLYGLTVQATPLPSERDQNVMVHLPSGERRVLKIANAGESRAMLDAECAAMQQLAGTGLCPQVIPTSTGDAIGVTGPHAVRLITAVPGVPLGTAVLRTDALRRDLGRALGLVDRALQSFDHPACHRQFHWDLAHAAAVVAAELPRVTDPATRQAIAHFAALHRTSVLPVLPTLRQSVIHADGNDYNILVDTAAQRVTGIIDFGDMVVSQTVNEVAIAMAYACLDTDDPLAAAAAVLAGYHDVVPLTEVELSVLFPLMAMRLCVSVCLAARQMADRPDVDYLAISQGGIARTLPQLAAIHPRFAHYRFRAACGLPPVPHSASIVSFLQRSRERIAPLLGHDLRTTPVAPIDLSVGSPLVGSDPADNAPAALDARIQRTLAAHGASIGVGGYDEARLIYAWTRDRSASEPRTVHIGLDLSVMPGTPLFAPLDGVVHGIEDADAHHDYGPLIVLRHQTDDAEPVAFYTLYGHLTRDSLDGLKPGQPIARGTEFARVGSAPTNGDWWAHVHVQLISDMLDVPCNVDGVVRASQRAVWHALCPDPNLLLGIPAERLPRVAAEAEIAASRRAHIGGNLSISYRPHPLTIVRGAGAYLFNADGHRFVDAYNNVAHVGHAHPRVVQAVSEQLGVLNTNTRYLQSQLMDYTEALLRHFPSPLDMVFFTASGSEANELALRLARAATGARDLVVMDSAYHGHTTTLIDISPYKHAGPGGQGAPDWVHTSPIPDVYRARGISGAPGAWFAAQVGDAIDRIRDGGRRLCGYIAESCPSVGGQIMMPDGFLPEVYARVRAAGGLCIADEVQTGFGRIGTHFWAFEQQGVIPDIVVLGKPIANGYPMGAVITTRAIAEAFNNGMEYFSTFGGSTAACVAARATLEVTLDEGLQANAHRVGGELLAGLRELAATAELVGDVRGAGLFIGVELVRDRTTREPAASEADFVVNQMRARGVLAGTDGPYHNVIKLRGPMPLSLDDAGQVIDTMRRALAEVPGR